jgi:hypothetical protein
LAALAAESLGARCLRSGSPDFVRGTAELALRATLNSVSYFAMQAPPQRRWRCVAARLASPRGSRVAGRTVGDGQRTPGDGA